MPSVARLKLDGRYDGLKQLIDESAVNLAALHKEVHDLEEAVRLARLCLEKVTHLKSTLETLVTTGLKEIYEKDYKFELREYRDQDTQTLKGLKPVLTRDGQEYGDLREDCGDGPRALISFLLRLSTVLMHPDCAKIIVADEPLGQIDSRAWVRFGEWLTDICKSTGLQVVLITHRESQFGDIYRVEQEKGVSRVTKVDENSRL